MPVIDPNSVDWRSLGFGSFGHYQAASDLAQSLGSAYPSLVNMDPDERAALAGMVVDPSGNLKNPDYATLSTLQAQGELPGLPPPIDVPKQPLNSFMNWPAGPETWGIKPGLDLGTGNPAAQSLLRDILNAPDAQSAWNIWDPGILQPVPPGGEHDFGSERQGPGSPADPGLLQYLGQLFPGISSAQVAQFQNQWPTVSGRSPTEYSGAELAPFIDRFTGFPSSGGGSVSPFSGGEAAGSSPGIFTGGPSGNLQGFGTGEAGGSVPTFEDLWAGVSGAPWQSYPQSLVDSYAAQWNLPSPGATFPDPTTTLGGSLSPIPVGGDTPFGSGSFSPVAPFAPPSVFGSSGFGFGFNPIQMPGLLPPLASASGPFGFVPLS